MMDPNGLKYLFRTLKILNFKDFYAVPVTGLEGP
jgi:hypothetical protein